MSKHRDIAFEIQFFESILKRDRRLPDVIEVLAELYTRTGRIRDGLRLDRRLVRLQPANAAAHYNLACSLALTKQRTPALRSLAQAVALGYRDFDWMREDPDLDCLKKLPQFRELLATQPKES